MSYQLGLFAGMMILLHIRNNTDFGPIVPNNGYCPPRIVLLLSKTLLMNLVRVGFIPAELCLQSQSDMHKQLLVNEAFVYVPAPCNVIIFWNFCQQTIQVQLTLNELCDSWNPTIVYCLHNSNQVHLYPHVNSSIHSTHPNKVSGLNRF